MDKNNIIINEILQSSGRKLDCLIAEHVYSFMHCKTPKDVNGEFGGEDILMPPNLNKDFTYPPKGRISYDFHVPNYHTYDEVYELENIIQSLGWNTQMRYLHHLDLIVKRNYNDHYYFSIIRAIFEEKLKAILITLLEMAEVKNKCVEINETNNINDSDDDLFGSVPQDSINKIKSFAKKIAELQKLQETMGESDEEFDLKDWDEDDRKGM